MRAFKVLLALILCLSPQTVSALDDETDRSPVDLVLSVDGSWLATANQSSNSVSLVRIGDGSVLDEVEVGRKPVAIALTPQGDRILVSACDSGEVAVLEVAGDRLKRLATIDVGFQPHGIAVAPDGSVAYVAQTAAARVAVVDLENRKITDHIEVGRWPRYVALSPDGSKLAVGTSGDRGVSVVDTATKKRLYIEQFVGLNIGHLQVSRDGKQVYFPWVVYRRNPITTGNIRLGWVLATRIGRVRLDGQARREAVSLDPQGKAIADPHGLALTSDERRLVVSAAGTHELLVYRLPDLPFQDYGSTDHIPPELLDDKDRFDRIELGGRPLGLRIAKDDRTVFVANALENSVQVVDLAERRLVRSIPLGGAQVESLVRRGERIFYDGRRSLDQWYSCHTCHYEGGGNSVAMDTLNDQTRFTFKTVLPLYNVSDTAPWTWHGWQQDLRDAMHKSLTTTMLGPEPTNDDVDALVAYVKSLKLPPNPFRKPDGSLSAAAERGQVILQSEQANCSACHNGRYFSDGEVHDVGTGKSGDRLRGFNTPSLIGVYRKVEFLHDGRVESLKELLTGPHRPSVVSGTKDLSGDDLEDLIAYLKSM